MWRIIYVRVSGFTRELYALLVFSVMHIYELHVADIVVQMSKINIKSSRACSNWIPCDIFAEGVFILERKYIDIGIDDLMHSTV